MARRADAAAGHQRLLAVAAVAGLAVATAAAFGRVFAGRIPTLLLMLVALASVGVAALFERRGLLVATFASLVGLALTIAWIVLPQTTWFGVPTLRTLRAVGRSLEFVGEQARTRVAPTPALAPLMLAAVTAVWTASFSTHALAVRAGSPLLAVLPPLALVGFADMVLEDGARPVYAIALLGSALAVVFADGLRRVRQWGPVWSGSRSRRARMTVRGSRPVALAVIGAAVLVPGLLPGFRADPLVDLSSTGEGGIGLDPFVSIETQLDDQAVRDLFEVKADEPAYWRLFTVDTFDGTAWTSSDPTARDGIALSTPATLPQAPGYGYPSDAGSLSQIFRVIDGDFFDSRSGLPMAQTPVAIPSGDLGEFRWDPSRAQAFVDGGLDDGLEYTVTSRIVVPTPEQLDRVIPLTPEQYGLWTRLPAGLDPEIQAIAEQWTAGQSNAYRKVLAIQNHLTDGSFGYSKDVDRLEGAGGLLEFLTETREGYCVHFAIAMAVLVRELGIPARIAIGYQSGTEQPDGSFLVQTKNAHSWVEVLFPGYGWLQFEPTPASGVGTHPNADAGSYLNPVEGRDGRLDETQPEPTPGPDPNATGARCDEAADPRQRQLLCNVETRPQNTPGGGFVIQPTIGVGAVPEEDGYSVPYRYILLGLLAVVGLLLVVVPIGKAAWRARTLRRSREPREHILAAYRVFEGEAADLGLGRREGETLDEHRARLSAAVAFSDGHLGRLASLATRAAYASEPPTTDDADASVRAARRAIRNLRRDAGFIRRIVGTYRPGV